MPLMDSPLQALILRARPDSVLCFADFMELALYHPEQGYYAKQRTRVGRSPDADFYTSVSLGPLYGQLIIEAFRSVLRGEPLDNYTLVELGTEPGQALFAEMDTPFGESLALPLGSDLLLPERAVVFANELLDAQSFHRLVFTGGHWRESGVKVSPEGLSECLLDTPTAEAAEIIARLPTAMPDGYRVDFPLRAEKLLDALCRQDWTGALIFMDYGMDWRQLVEATPQGTARAFHAHRQHNELLARPGEQDLTCHVCWDPLMDILSARGFANVAVEPQEHFLVTRAGDFLKNVIENKDTTDAERRAAVSLLHPGFFGRKFQALNGVRLRAWN